ncbi:AMP-dependent synthetase/ligase [Hirsutella rhossiliensis]|uniref:AMP-dependent synthetase/ligase n=1 Tax=Hirsutella rhossiliensis TaxID=111463 RepID=A0A9P8MW08_9HYPO|nr:AMP-dependent synthetase/ligase [Hirsutella rhossiliensis]KAH0961424.1 AMP-dependent synthetase/ligase [Hirsutella rhossiliensis]
MPVQRTFTLIQPIPGAAAAPRTAAQPMTSKQVRKAYKAATRAAPVPRAERLRQERAEQDRIRRELDRDRAAARARAARERRRETAVGEREARRRQGLPLADVRPSQDTIAKFVRGNASGRKRGVPAGPGPPDDGGDERAGRRRASGAAAAEGSFEIDLIPEEDELDLEALEQLDTAVNAAAHGQSREPDTARRGSSSSSPAASGRSPHGRSRPATPYELDLGLRDYMPRDKALPPPGTQHDEPPTVPPPASLGSRRPLAAVQPPPAGTQAILFNPDDFFPSSSQQERELREEMAATVDTLPHPPEPPPPDPTTAVSPSAPRASPRRFFTASGDQELVTLALQRSRRSAALEEMQQRERGAAAQAAAMSRARKPQSAKAAVVDAARCRGGLPRAEENLLGGPDKENVAPRADGGGFDAPDSSPETEYGGEWIDEIAVELKI